MALPSLDELRRLYESTPTLGQGIEGALAGGIEGADLANKIAQRKQEALQRQREFQQKVEQLGLERRGVEVKEAEEKRKQDLPTDNFKTVGKSPEGYLIQENTKTGEIRTSNVKGDLGTGKGLGNIADQRRISNILGVFKEPDTQKAKDIIAKGARIERLGTSSDIVQSPENLALLESLLVGQAEGGKASMLGIQKASNTTAQQFVARVMEKIRNKPQDADTQAFIDQSLAQSRAESVASLLRYKANLNSAAARASAQYPDQIDAIKNSADNEFKAYVKQMYGKEPGADASEQDLEDIVQGSGKGKTKLSGAAAAFKSKYGL